ncbi:hypothetical protein ACFVFS_34040 [Kitasatospora sp. NPDC057692]|uniref:hypothetical protein n=1 Tax=Kitasatospora sp. NPDC057692 TaxID=3346215 RepID=UPI003679CAA1
MTEPAYAEEAARTFTVEEYPEGLLLRGPCPRCGTHIQIELFEAVFSRGPTPGGSPTGTHADGPEAGSVEPVICTCEEPHPGRPADDIGCGAFWVFLIGPEQP